ncbi:MAG: BatA domain-containing protein [Planctomycetales bacterium]
MQWLSAVFMNPLMLAAIAAVVVPIIIEWLFRRRKRRIELPTIRFLLDNEEQQKIRRQDRILLLLRMAAIGLLVFAIARPLLQHGWVGGKQDRNVFVLLDGTASMNQQVDVTTSFGLAQRKAAAVIRALPEKTTAVTVVHLGDKVTVPVDGEKDLHTAAAKVEALSAGAGAASIAPALDWVKDRIEQQKLAAAEIYVFSDFQKHTWKREGDQSVVQGLKELDGRCETYMVDVGGQPQFNYVVTDLRPEEFVLSAGMELRFQAAVAVRGTLPDDKQQAPVTFLVDGIKKAVQEVDLSGGSAALTFQHRFPGAGEYLVEVTVDGDDHRVDNSRMYICRVPDDVRVLVLDESVDATEDPNRFESLFLTTAMRPATHAGLEKLSHFQVKTISPLKFKFENLAEYGTVVLTDLSRLDQGLVETLEAYVDGGGTLWMFAGPKMNLYDYNRQLYRDGKGLLPAHLAEKATAPVSGDDVLVLQYGESQHAALRGAFPRTAGNREFNVEEYVKLDIDPRQDSSTQVVVPFSNGEPGIVEKRFGQGRTLLFATSCDFEWTFLPASWDFPTLVQELLRYSVGNPDRGVNLDVGQPFEQPVYVSMQHLLLRRPDGSKERLTPTARRDESDLFQVNFDETTQQGLYRIETIDEVLPRRRFVVNQPSQADEGDLDRLAQKDFADTFSSSSGWRWMGPEVTIDDFAKNLHTVTEIAPWILWLLGGVLAIESFLAWRFGRRRGEAV